MPFISPKYCPGCGGAVGFDTVSKQDGFEWHSTDYGNREVPDQGHLCQNPKCDVIGVLCAPVPMPIKPKTLDPQKS